jgi:mycothiol system anti-sigma-R factor
MNCLEIEARLHPYVDGELSVDDTAAADAHVATCASCGALARRERAFRQLLGRQPRESAPPELRARVMTSLQRDARRQPARRVAWLVASALAAVIVFFVALGLPSRREPAPLLAALVDKHIAYAQLERPAELASGNRVEVAEWFSQRAGMRVTVPDFSGAGIHLVGARLADADARRAAYLLYEKGHTLMSVFMVPQSAGTLRLTGTSVSYRGNEYRRDERKGHRAVMWADGQAVFGLVSSLDDEALLECADRLRRERADATRL